MIRATDVGFVCSAVAAGWLAAPLAALYLAGAESLAFETRALWAALLVVLFIAGWVSARRSSA